MKTCSKCKARKRRTSFAKDTSRADGLSYVCRQCSAARNGRYLASNAATVARRKQTKYRADPDARRRQKLGAWKRKGYPEPTRPMPTNCECCEYPQDTLHLDHDHVTGKFRGWLCGCCNRGIGLLDDNLNGVCRAYNYLRNCA